MTGEGAQKRSDDTEGQNNGDSNDNGKWMVIELGMKSNPISDSLVAINNLISAPRSPSDSALGVWGAAK